ncbi:hypothetical protein PLICRDRAFT_340741 [Plicaturopsis crispa FD-325 SS-3]|uniref:Uncharacterized protein n=1 Tax=Plicaturopsis crispa FD-325 SS-3 TaxID=944288 RepID=A0A0C9SRK5_PLICR|nr:hypothetical protein PLICRDRAFT_340741 [Plicaturopsis crispa FD-325 SS-3]
MLSLDAAPSPLTAHILPLASVHRCARSSALISLSDAWSLSKTAATSPPSMRPLPASEPGSARRGTRCAARQCPISAASSKTATMKRHTESASADSIEMVVLQREERHVLNQDSLLWRRPSAILSGNGKALQRRT